MTEQPPRLMIVDACVLIDFFKTDRSVLSLVSSYVGPTYVVSTVLEEVKNINTEEDLAALGLIVIVPELEDLFEAEKGDGPTSRQDRLCFLTAKRHGYTCVTNDKNLRRLCSDEGVDVCWGLQLIAKLHAAGGLTARVAKAIAMDIHRRNTKHITMEIVDRFNDMIDSQR